MSPLVHLDLEADEALTVEEQAHDTEQAEPEQASPARAEVSPMAKQPDLVDKAMSDLTAAVASGDLGAIAAAQRGLEEARDETQRQHQRRKDLQTAETAANKLKAEAARAAKTALADKAEQKIRRRAQRIRFEAPRKRYLVVTMGGKDIEPAMAAEACKRISYALSMATAAQLQASRNAGRSIAIADWATPLLNDESAGVATHIRLGICRVVNGGK